MSNELFLAVAGNAAGAGADTDANFENTVLLLNADGASDGGQNNTFRDVSGNGHSITRNGNVTQGSFSPFSVDDGKWGNYFSTSSSITVPDSSGFNFGSGDFTIEGWVYIQSFGSDNIVAMVSQWDNSNRAWVVYVGPTAITFSYSTNLNNFNNVTNASLTNNLNEWMHISATREGNDIRVFKNGTLVASSNTTDTISNSTKIVQVNTATNYGQGELYVSNLRIVKGTAVYTSAFTPSTTPLTAISGTELLICQSNRFVDNSTNDFTVSTSGTPKVVPFSPFPKTTAYTQSVVNQGSVKFDGSGDYLDAPTSSDFSFGTGAYTAELWVYPTRSSGENGLFSTFTASAYGIGMWHSGTTVNFEERQNAYSATNPRLTSTALVLNQWNHLAMSRDSNTGTLKAFVNGVEVDSETSNLRDITATSETHVGANNAAANDHQGYISNFRIVKGTAVYTADFTVPTAPLEDITNTSLLTCQANGFVDNSSNAHTITVNGDPEITTFVPFGERSVDFDGTDDSLVASYSSQFLYQSGDFTAEAWIYPESLTGGRSIVGVWGTIGASNNASWLFYINGSNIYWYVSTNGSTQTAAITVAHGMSINNWYHVALSRSSGTTRIFVNGSEVGNTSTVYDLYDSTSGLIIGRNPIGGTPDVFSGKISNVRVIKGTAVYTADFAPPQEPLTAITNTSLLTCQNAVFQDNSGNAHAITANGDPQASTNLPFGERSVYFDGSGDALDTTVSALGTSDVTIEFWFYPTDSSATYRDLVETRSGGAGDTGFGIFQYGLTIELYGNGLKASTSANAFEVNTWTHFALVKTSGGVQMYINGVANGSDTYAPNYTSTTRAIGYNSNSQFYFAGYISNVREVASEVYTADFDVPTEPLTAVANTKLLTCQDAVFQDNSGNAHAITVNGDAKASTNIPFAPVTTYGVQQYLDDAFTVSPQGGSGYFDGTGDYLQVANDSSFLLGSGDFTVEFWLYKMASADYLTPLGNLSSANTNAFSTLLNTAASQTINWYSNSTSYVTSTSQVRNFEWTHIAYVRESGTIKLYFNGVLEDSAANTIDYNVTNTLTIGNDTQLFSGRMWNGYISDVRMVKGTAVYTSNFTPSAPLTNVSGTGLLTNFTNASIVDATGKNVLETVGNAQVDTTTVKYGTGSMYFDGTGDRLTFPSSEQFAFGTGDFTVEFWINSNDVSGSTQKGLLQTSDTTGGLKTTYTTGIFISQGQNNSGTALNGGLSANVLNTRIGSTTAVLTTGTWHHVALVRSSGTVTLYADGVSNGSATVTGSIGGENLVVGGFYNTSYLYDGYMDDLRITKGIARYTANFTPPTAALPVIGE